VQCVKCVLSWDVRERHWMSDWRNGRPASNRQTEHFLSWSSNSINFMQINISLPQSNRSTLPHHVLQILLILSSHLHLGLQIVVSLRSTIRNHVYTLPVSHICHMPCTSLFLDFNTRIIWADKRNVDIEKNWM